MKYLVRDCDPNTGEPDDEGYDDEYVVCSSDTSADGPSSDMCASPLIIHNVRCLSSVSAGGLGGDGG